MILVYVNIITLKLLLFIWINEFYYKFKIQSKIKNYFLRIYCLLKINKYYCL